MAIAQVSAAAFLPPSTPAIVCVASHCGVSVSVTPIEPAGRTLAKSWSVVHIIN